MKRIGLLFFYFSFICCSNVSESKKIEPEVREAKSSHEQIKYSDYNNSTFTFSNDTIVQTLDIKIESENTIEFSFSSKNVKRNLSFELKGLAKLSEKEDMESDVDEDGNGYFVDEYIYQKNCSVIFRLDADEFRRATVFVRDCHLNSSRFTPIASIGIMHRVK